MNNMYDILAKLNSVGKQNLTEGKKPDFLDLDKDGNKKEPMAQAAQQAKEMDEGSTGDYSAKKARAGKDIGKPGKTFAKIAKSAGKRYGSKERGEKVAGAVLAKLRAKESIEEADMEEGNDFTGARLAAIKAGKPTFSVGGKTYRVTGDTSDEKVMEKKEKTVWPGTKEYKAKYGDEMKIGDKRKSSTGGEVERTATGVKHTAKAHDDEEEAKDNDTPKKKGRPKGSKRAIGAKVKGTSKLHMKGAIKEADLEEDYDQDEYDEEGEMAKSQSHTIADAAKELQMMLGDDENLPEWVQKKITLAQEYIDAARDYLKANRPGDEMAMAEAASNAARMARIAKSCARDAFSTVDRRMFLKAAELFAAGDETRGLNAINRMDTEARDDFYMGCDDAGIQLPMDEEVMPMAEAASKTARMARIAKACAREATFASDRKGFLKAAEFFAMGDEAKGLRTIERMDTDARDEFYMGCDDAGIPVPMDEVAPPGAKAERMVKHIKKGYTKDGKLTPKEKSIAYATAWKAHKAGKVEEESTDTRDDRAEKAGRKVAKDIEYDEKVKDRIHGKKRGSEDDKAERAGRKVTKDIEHDEKVDETTVAGSVATAPAGKAKKGMIFGKGVYESQISESFDAKLNTVLTEGISINANQGEDGKKSMTVTATDEDAVKLAHLLQLAGMPQAQDYHDVCPGCGQSPCGCEEELEEADLANSPDEQTYSTDAMVNDLSGGLNGRKTTGQTTDAPPNLDRDRQSKSYQAQMAEGKEQSLWELYQRYEAK